MKRSNLNRKVHENQVVIGEISAHTTEFKAVAKNGENSIPVKVSIGLRIGTDHLPHLSTSVMPDTDSWSAAYDVIGSGFNRPIEDYIAEGVEFFYEGKPLKVDFNTPSKEQVDAELQEMGK